MISRRNIRVKVMQTLYASDSGKTVPAPKDAVVVLDKKIEQTRQLFTYLVYFLTEVARYAETDARNRAAKHLPTADDLKVNTRIAGNLVLWKVLEDSSFQSATEDLKLQSILPRDLVRKIYDELVQTEEYQDYIQMEARFAKQEKKMMEFIFNSLMLPNELFISHIEEQFINWDDDAEMMQGLVLNYLSKPGVQTFSNFLSPEKAVFAKTLLTTVIEKREYTLGLIKPRLKNWDAERIAALDLILLQMGICEFLYFETIPTRVTINEYIDLAKAYSTEQSGQFVNGLLDSIHKDLMAENKIEKKVFKNSTL
ncbi:MAG TPA: transcription antitermination factor NusB [Ferruginibacter sp.]|nr:transcription antitermination factor NusB [Ferruginibacter sp.]HRO05781.1 transcription antitermination factor NusB [Ferruginibacter sp.]HRO95925.1 transcription antitermination factor NusB [Ferruginibacter sp.]HRP48738.1 transcription antitermination factor NusB [Ferruginibacter sp.]